MPNSFVRVLGENDFEVFYSWCDAHQFPKLPRSILSSRGYMVFIEDKPIVAGFLYKDETSGFCFFAWPVMNPLASSKEREEGFSALIEHVRVEANKIGGLMMVATPNHQGLINRYMHNGFKSTDQNITLLTSEV